MNRIHKSIAERIAMGKLPTAYDAWDKTDITKTAMALTTRAGDYMRRGQMIVFEKDEQRT